jgi:sporulation protein YlmC with PRC-barrel domain
MAKIADYGAPASYLTLTRGIPVYTSDGKRLGTVERVLADFASDVFDGIVVGTRSGERFVDAPRVGELYERAVVLALTGEEARSLPGPPPVPPVIQVGPQGLEPDRRREPEEGSLRKAWQRVFGRR